MKKTLVLFALVAISVALVVLTAVHGQNSNSGGQNSVACARINELPINTS